MQQKIDKVLGLLEEELEVRKESEYSLLDSWEAVVGETTFYFGEVDAWPTTDEGKWQNGGTIYELTYRDESGEEKDTGIFYCEEWYRSGSYYTEYYYEHGVPYQVMKQPKMIVVESWEAV